MPASMIVQLNGLTEVVLALALGIGVFTRALSPYSSAFTYSALPLPPVAQLACVTLCLP